MFTNLFFLPWAFSFTAGAVIHPLVAEDPSLSPFSSHVQYEVTQSERSIFRNTIEQDLKNLERLDCLTTNRFIDPSNRGLYRMFLPQEALDKIVEAEQPSALEKRLLPAHILGPIYRVRPLGLNYLTFPTPVWTTREESVVFIAKATSNSYTAQALNSDLERLRGLIPELQVSCIFDDDAVMKVKAELETRKVSSCNKPLVSEL